MSIVANPFDRYDLYIASEVHPAITDTVDRADGYKAFRRQIDAWWLALAIGVQHKHRKPFTSTTVKFQDGTIFGSDPWRITHLQLLGLAWFGPEALDRPSEIVTAANEYANGGFEWIVETVVGAPNQTLAVYNRIDELIAEVAAPAAP